MLDHNRYSSLAAKGQCTFYNFMCELELDKYVRALDFKAPPHSADE